MGWTYFPGEESTAIQVDGAGRIFIGSDVGSLRTSADHGVSWAAVPGVAPGILSLGRNSRGQILAGLGYGPGYAGLCNPAGCQVATGIQASARVSSFTLLPSGSVVAITGWASDIWISTDQGSSYSKRSTISLNGEGIAITSDAQGILYAGGEFDGVYRSLDGGMSWAAFGLQERCGIQAFAFNASGELLASCPSSVPIRRLRNGAWTGSSLGVPAYWLVSDLLSLRDGRIAATACRNGIAAIYLSSDGGATWTDQSPPAGVVGCPRLAEHPLGYLFATSKTGVHRLRLR